MILKTAFLLTALGLVAWGIGYVVKESNPIGIPISVLGGVVVLGVGAQVLNTGLQYRAGKVTEKVVENSSTASTNATTTVEYTFQTVPLPTNLSLGLLVMLLGGLLIVLTLEEEAL